ncbi:MAG: hypothetical protein U0521_22470 [Anaerolineae bacterium]
MSGEPPRLCRVPIYDDGDPSAHALVGHRRRDPHLIAGRALDGGEDAKGISGR